MRGGEVGGILMGWAGCAEPTRAGTTRAGATRADTVWVGVNVLRSFSSGMAQCVCGADGRSVVSSRQRPNMSYRVSRAGRAGSRTRLRHAVAATASVVISRRPSGSMSVSDGVGSRAGRSSSGHSSVCVRRSLSEGASAARVRTSTHRSGASRAARAVPVGAGPYERTASTSWGSKYSAHHRMRPERMRKIQQYRFWYGFPSPRLPSERQVATQRSGSSVARMSRS